MKLVSKCLFAFLSLVICLNLNGVVPGLAQPVLPGTPTVASAADYAAFFDSFIPAQMNSEHLVGVTAAVVQKDQLVFSKGYGMNNLASQTPVQADQSLFFIGSDGKLFTWTAVMQLVEQGKLDLHADVNTYLDFQIPATFPEPITLHHLMTHTAGFEDEFNTLFVEKPEQLLPLREHLVRYLPKRVYPAGKVSAYSNYGTALAGYIIERVTGQPFEAYLADHLVGPLGMKRTAIGNTLSAEHMAALSTGYHYQGGNFVPAEFERTAALPTAPIRTTVTDLSRFMRAHLNGGCLEGACILRPDTLTQMHTQQFTHHPQMGGMAYGFLSMPINGQQVLWHLGESTTFTTLVALIPGQNLGLAVSYNTTPVDARKILFRFMDQFFPVQRPAVSGPLPGWQERAAQFNGFYAPARSAQTTSQVLVRYPQTVPVTIEQGQLTFSGWNFAETTPGVFRQVDGDRVIAFEQDANGRRWLYFGPLAYYQVPWYETLTGALAAAGLLLLAFLMALVAWPLQTGLRKGMPRPEIWQQGVALGLGVYNFGLLAWFLSLMGKLAADFVFSAQTASLIGALYWLAVPWTVLVIFLAGRAWLRRTWGLSWRIQYSFFAFAAAVFVWFLWNVHLL